MVEMQSPQQRQAMQSKPFFSCLWVVAMLCIAMACGGGGGSSSSSDDTTSTESTTSSTLLSGTVSTFDTSTSSKARQKARSAGTVNSDDFAGTQSIVTLYLLDDEDLANPITTLKTADDGSYDVTAEDVKDYLLSVTPAPITESSTDTEVLDAFKALGAIKIRAMYETADGEIATIETFKDISELDPSTDAPIATNPLTTIVLKQLESVFEQFGITLDQDQLESFASLVDSIIESQSEIELADGQSLDDYITDFENENVAEVDDTQKGLFLAQMRSGNERLDETSIGSIRGVASARTRAEENPDQVTSNATGTVSTVVAGLISNMEREILDTQTLTPTQKKEGFQRFLLSMGLMVETVTGNLLVPFDAPADVDPNDLPGKSAFGKSKFREVALTGSSNVFDEFFSFKQSYEAADDELTFRQEDLAFLYHDFADQVEEGIIFSDNVITLIMDKKNNTTIKHIASVIADTFSWRTESVQLLSVGGEDFPIFSGVEVPPDSGEEVDPTEIIKRLSFKLEATPASAARGLTENTESFYLQFADDAIEELQRNVFADDSGEETFAFPSSEEDLKELIMGTVSGNATRSFEEAQKLVESGMVAAFPPASSANSLYGQQLNGDTSLDIRAGFFLINFVLESDFLVDSSKGYIETITEGNVSEVIPRFDNFKFLVPSSEDFSLADFTASLLSLSNINESDAFETLQDIAESGQLYDALPELLFFKESESFRDDFLDDLEDNGLERPSSILVDIDLENFDGSDLDPSDLTLTLYPVRFGFDGPEILSEEAEVTMSTSDATGETLAYSASIDVSESFSGREYILKIVVENREHSIEPLGFYVDGWHPAFDFETFILPPDEEFKPLPGIALYLDDEDENEQLLGFSFSAFVADEEAIVPADMADLTFVSTSEGLVLELGANVSMEQVHITEDGALTFETSPTTEPLFDLNLAFGFELKSLIGSLKDSEAVSLGLEFSDDQDDLDDQFSEGAEVYMLEDTEENFWMVSIEYVSAEEGFLELSFAEIKRDGSLDFVDTDFDFEEDDGMEGEDHMGHDEKIVLFFGDYLDLATFEISAPEGALFGFDEDIAAMAHIRYAGAAYLEAEATDSLDDILGDEASEPDFSMVESRLDWEADMGGLALITFSPSTRSYTVPTEADDSVTALSHGDLVAIASGDEATEDQVFDWVARIEQDPNDKGEIALDLLPFEDVVGEDGEVLDEDRDGVPEAYDFNDEDSNIGGPNPFEDDKGGEYRPVEVFMAKTSDDERQLMLEFDGFVHEVHRLKISEAASSKDEAEALTSFADIFYPTFDDEEGEWRVEDADGEELEDHLYNASGERLSILIPLTDDDVEAKFSGDMVQFKVLVEFKAFEHHDDASDEDFKLEDTQEKSRSEGLSEDADIVDVFEAIVELDLSSENEVGLFDDSRVTITIGRDTPEGIRPGLNVDGGQDVTISWDRVDNAEDYIVTMVDEFGDFHMDFFLDFEEGESPELFLHAGKLPGGRDYSIRITARGVDQLGNFTGIVSIVTFQGIYFSGGFDGDDDFEDEVKLEAGDVVVFGEFPEVVAVASDAQREIFSVVAIAALETGDTLALSLSDNVEAHLTNEVNAYAEGDVFDEGQVYVDSLSSPMVGYIDDDMFLEDFEDESASTAILVRSGNMILPAAGSGLFLFDLDNDDMMIDAIMESGYYGLGFNDTDLVFGVDVHIMMPHHDDASESMPDSNADMMMDEDKASPIFVRVEDLAEDKPATGGVLDLTIGDLVTFSWVLEDGREQKLELELMFVTEEDGMDIAKVGFHVKDPVEKLDKNSEFDLDGDENIDMVVNLDQEDTTFSVDSVAFVSYWDEDLEETVDVSLDDADLVIDFETTLHYEVELISGDEYTVELDLEADEVMIEELEDFEDAFEDEDLSDLE